MIGVGRNGWGSIAVAAQVCQQSSAVQKRCARGKSILIQDRMGKLYVFFYRLLHKLGILLPSRLGDNVPYELLDSGVDVFLASARHGRIFALLVLRCCRQMCTVI